MALTDDHATERRTSERRAVGATRLDSVCHVPSDQVVAMRAAHVAEVQSLHRRIDALEQALATSEAARSARASAVESPAVTSIQFTPDQDRRRARDEDNGPARSEASPVDPGSEAASVLDEMVSTVTSGAAAWDDAEVSFAERVAARAFFREDVKDERARRWLLRDSS